MVEKIFKDVFVLEVELGIVFIGWYSVLWICKFENINLLLEVGSCKLDLFFFEDVVFEEEEDEDVMDIDGEICGFVVKDYGI